MAHGGLSRGGTLLVVLAGTALVVVGCGTAGGSASPSAPAAAPTVVASAAAGGIALDTATDPTLGAILVGQDGKTLYVFTKDGAGKSACNGDCATAWPPLVLGDGETVSPGAGVTGVLGTIARDDGSMQVTYAGAPLYYFAADAKAGDVNGQGVNGVWFVATPAGASGGAAPSPTAADDDYTRGGGATKAPGSAEPSSVDIADFSFAPATLTVPVGTTVTWRNSDNVRHTVTADDAGFDSGALAQRDAFSTVFTAAGTFAYHCAIHPQMVGSVVVTQ